MTSQLENALTFAKIWNLDRPQAVHVISRQESNLIQRVLKEEGVLFPPDMEGRKSMLYGGTAEDFDRREKGEFAQRLLQIFSQVLNHAYVSDECKEYLTSHLQTSLSLGLPASLAHPLQDIGIIIAAERYGIFDKSADLKQIEADLLECKNYK